jgi:fatty acid-binding protein DegV
MEKYAIVIDSCVYLLDEEIEKFGIKRVSLNIIDGHESYKEVDVTSEFVFDRLDKGHKLTTSQPSP